MVSRANFLVKLGDDGQWQWAAVPSPKFTSDWYQKLPAESTPRFLVDLGPDYSSLKETDKIWPWKVISVPDLYLDDFHGAQALLDQGWGAISYQWGEFLPVNDLDTKKRKCRPFWPSRSPLDRNNLPDHNLPAAYKPPNVSPDMANAWAWGIPMISKIPILGIKQAVKIMGKRFVWWDGACLPQRDFSKGFESDLSRVPPYTGPPWLPGNLGDIAGEEVAKQKFVYQKATVGVIWLNQINWEQPSKLRTVITKLPAMISNEAVRTLLYRDSDNALKIVGDNLASVVLSNVLKAINEAPMTIKTISTALPDAVSDPNRVIPSAPAIDPSKFPKIDPPATPFKRKKVSASAEESPSTLDVTSYGETIQDPNIMKGYITKFCELLEDIRKEEPWFRSLWSYQEGRLLGSHAFLDVQGRVLSLPSKQYTTDGNFIPFPRTRILMDDGSYRDGNSPGINELSAFVTLLAGEISLAYTAYCGAGIIRKAIAPLLQLWNADKGIFLNSIMQRLVCTGLLFNSNEAPLELLLGARRTRFPSLFYADEYNAMTGVLGLFKINDKEDYTMIEGTNNKGFKDDDKNKVWHYETLPKALFEAMIKRFQWHCLMLAKLPVDKVSHWGAVAMGHFETINPYLENLVIENELTIERSDWKFVLPTLTYMPDRDELQILPPKAVLQGITISGSSFMKALPVSYIAARRISREISGWNDKSMMLWTLATEVQYIDDEWKEGGRAQDLADRATKPSNNVTARSVTLDELGGRDKFLLIPFESLGHNMTTKATQDTSDNILNQRCLLITDTVYGTEEEWLDGTFGGIVDVKGIATKPEYWCEIRMKWQKKAESKDSSPATTNGNIAPATTPANATASTMMTTATSSNANTIPPKTSTGTTASQIGGMVSAAMPTSTGTTVSAANAASTPAATNTAPMPVAGSTTTASTGITTGVGSSTSSGSTVPALYATGKPPVGAGIATGIVTGSMLTSTGGQAVSKK